MKENQDQVETKRECRRCVGKGLLLIVYAGPTGRARTCPDCNGDGWVSAEMAAEQRLKWPQERNGG